MTNLTKDILKHSKLKNSQELALFTYQQVLKSDQAEFSALAKTASAMANAIGGNILIGLKLNKTRPEGWEKKPENFPEPDTIKSLINSHIQPQLKQLKVTTIDEGILITVPESLSLPHMFENYKFYKRVLSKNVVMEEFEIRQAYQKTKSSDLQIIGIDNLQGIPQMSSGLFSSMKFYPRIHIQNLGQQLEKVYKLEISIPSALVDESFTVLHKYLKGYDKNSNLYSITGSEPLFQDEIKTMIELVLKLNMDNYSTFLNSELILTLYSSEKIHKRTFLCREWFHYQGQLPELNSFVKKIKE